jgi:hypothetical protein
MDPEAIPAGLVATHHNGMLRKAESHTADAQIALDG